MKKFKKLLVCMLAIMMLISSAIPVSAATRPAIPTLRSAQMTSSGRMSLSWKSVSNANGYKVRIYNCRKKKASSIHLSGRYNNNYYTNKSANTAYLVSVYSYRWVNGQRIYSIDSDAFVCTPRTLTTVSSTASTLTVKWSKLYGISGYYVYKSTSSNSGYKRYATLSANATSVKVKSLTSSGNTYFYVVPYRVYKGKRYTFPHNIYRMYTRYYYY